MSSVRMWLMSGVFAAGVGSGLFCGAGVAAADAGADAGTARSAAHEAASARSERGPARTAGARPAAAAVRVPTVRPARKTPAPASAVNAAPAVKSAVSAPQPAAAQSTAAKSVSPSSVPVDPAKYAGTYYEQGSVKQFFSIGLVNTKATYTLNPDGTIKVQNSGNYFFNRGPRSSITGSAVAVNDTNTALNVGFFSPRPPSATPRATTRSSRPPRTTAGRSSVTPPDRAATSSPAARPFLPRSISGSPTGRGSWASRGESRRLASTEPDVSRSGLPPHAGARLRR